MMRPAFAVVVFLLTSLLCGCYTYAPVGAPDGSMPPGAEVRVELTPVGAGGLAALVGPRAVRVEGRLQSIESDGTIMLVPRTVHSMDGSRSEWTGDATLRLQPDAVSSLTVRRFSRRRTLIAAGTATVGAIAIGAAAVRLGGDKGGGTENPPPAPPP